MSILDILKKNSPTSFSKEKITALNKSQAVIEFGMDGTIIWANENFLKTMGYSLGEIKGKHHSMFIEPELAQSREYDQFWRSLNRGEYQVAQYKRLGKGGREVWIEASYNPLIGRNGKPFRVVKYATDITKQKLEEANVLGQIDAIHRSLAVIEFEMDGTIIWANENFLRVMGYSLDEITGKHHRIFAEPEFAGTREYDEFWKKLNRGEYQAAQYKRLGKGGKEVWIEASYNPILDPNGVPFKVIKFATDITPRKNENRLLAEDFERNVQSVIDTVADSALEMQSTAQIFAAAAEETSCQSSVVAGASKELSDSVCEISEQIERSGKTVQIAVEEARSSETFVSELVESVSKIGKVTSLISGIAEQTNLLALNATIQAASAGEAGKGFAVVAQEVKDLAVKTSESTDEITNQIKAIQTVSESTADSIHQIIETISQIEEMSATISAAVEKQTSATEEVSSNIAGVQDAAGETGEASTKVLSLSEDLSGKFKELQNRVGAFLEKVHKM